MSAFRTGDILKESWGIFKEKMLLVWLVLAIMWGISFFFGIFQENVGEESAFGALISLVSFVATILLELGMIRVFLNLVDHKEAKIEQLFSESHHFFRCLGAFILFGLGVLIGLILLIIPGIYIALRYGFFAYFIIDKDTKIMESFEKSANVTKGIKWQLIVFALAMLGVNILGFLCLGIGLLFTIPVTSLSFAVLYRRLVSNGQSEVNTTKAPETVPSDTPLVPPAPVA